MSDNPSPVMWMISRHLVSLPLVGALLLISPAPARAQDDAARAEASERFNRGIDLFDEEQFEAALAEFTRAYELAPNFVVLLNVGHSYRRLGRNPEAVEAFERYLEEGGDGVTASRLADVEQELSRLRRLVGQIDVVVTRPSSTTVYLDDTEAGHTPLERPLTVSAGSHVIEVRAEGFLTERREVNVAGEAEVFVEFSLTPSDPGEADDDEDDEDDDEDDTVVQPPSVLLASGSRRRRIMRTLAYVMFGTTAAALGTALGLYLWNTGRHTDWEDENGQLEALSLQFHSSDQTEVDELLGRLDENDRLAESIDAIDIANWAVFGVGVAALAVAFGLFFGAPDDDALSSQVSLIPQPGGGLVTLTIGLR